MTIQSHRRYLSKRIVGGDGIFDPTDFTIDSGGPLPQSPSRGVTIQRKSLPWVILALLLGCGLRRQELAQLKAEDIVEWEGRAVIVDLVGKGRRVRTVAVPYWVKQSVEQWTSAAGITKGPLLRSVSKSGKLGETALGDWSVWSVVESCAREIGVEDFGPHDLRRTCAKLCRKSGGDLEQIKFLLGHSSIQTTERYPGSEQEIAVAVNDRWSL